MTFANTGTLTTRVYSLFHLSDSLKYLGYLTRRRSHHTVAAARRPRPAPRSDASRGRRVSPYVIAARRARLADERRGDPRAKPCCKTFHLPRMCTGFLCAPPAIRRSPLSFQGLPEFCCKTFPLYRM